MGLAWVIWPDDCGMSDCVSVECLQTIATREVVVEAIQVIAPIPQLSNPLERAFLAGASRSSASKQIVNYDGDDDETRPRPYYRSRR